MTSNARVVGWILLVQAMMACTLTGCGSALAPPPFAVQQQLWTSPDGNSGVQLLTKHYDIRLTTSDEMLREHIAPFMETAFDEYSRMMVPTSASEKRMVIYLFGAREEWARFVRKEFPAQANVYLHIHAGGFVDPRTGIAVIHDIGRDKTLSLLAHEGFHQFVARWFPASIPPWLNEGLATQWEAFDLKGLKPVFTPSRNFLRTNNLRAALGPQGELLPLPELLRMHAGHAIVQTGSTVRTYYAQLWSTILFLQEGEEGKYADRFARLLKDAGTNRLRHAVSAYRAASPENATLPETEIIFRHYLTEDLPGFTAEYIEFARQLVH